MSMPETARRWTTDMVRALPDDGKRHEVVDGELLATPTPGALHQRAVLELAVRLRGYANAHRLGEALMSPADIEFREDRLVQPDLFVAPLLASGKRIRQWSQIRGLLLAVEVLSPSTARADRQVKRRLYQEEPVGEYWIVDLDARVIERWRHGDQRPEVLSERLVWHPHAAVAPLEIDLPALFGDLLDH